MVLVGVDENGLGPRLGPLIATAVVVEASSVRRVAVTDAARALGLDDSKAVSGFGRMAGPESLALALIAHTRNALPSHVDALLDLIALDGLLGLRVPCPSVGTDPCWGGEPLRLPALGGCVQRGHEMLGALRERGIRVRRVRSVVTCVRVLNGALKGGATKLDVDLACFERLLGDARRASRRDLHAYCGRVGGIRRYAERFTTFASDRVVRIEESKLVSRYGIAGFGEVSFEVDADARRLPVALASMVGKYIRELLVERHNRFYARHDESLAPASGYHDPVTARFVAATVELRGGLQIPDACFERQR